MKTLLFALIVLSVSVLSAQDLKETGVNQHAAVKDHGLFAGTRVLAFNEVPPIAAVQAAKIDFGKKTASRRSFVQSLREEMKSWTGALPDLTTSLLGVFCYVRNPLKFVLAPSRSFRHELGFRTDDWMVSVDGIRSNNLQDVEIALHFPMGKASSLLIKRNNLSYTLDFDLTGELPWE